MPRAKTVALPDEPGAVVEPGPFDGPGGPVSVPQRLAVGEGPEVFEAQNSTETRLAIGMTANGRISHPGEVDRYLIPVKAGDRLRFEVQAAALGSWLDLGPRRPRCARERIGRERRPGQPEHSTSGRTLRHRLEDT
jgi:hypothetical protein